MSAKTSSNLTIANTVAETYTPDSSVEYATVEVILINTNSTESKVDVYITKEANQTYKDLILYQHALEPHQTFSLNCFLVKQGEKVMVLSDKDNVAIRTAALEKAIVQGG